MGSSEILKAKKLFKEYAWSNRHRKDFLRILFTTDIKK